MDVLPGDRARAGLRRGRVETQGPPVDEVAAGASQPPTSASAPAPAPDNVIIFRDDDAGYRSWLYAHMAGFVVNAGRTPSPGYLMLHRATCETITPTPDRVWTRDYAKVCASDRYELEAWARALSGRLTACEFCDP